MFTSYRLQWKLRQLVRQVEESTVSGLQSLYLEAFHLCEQLPAHKKSSFSARLKVIRKIMEKQWQTEQEVQLLLQQGNRGNYQKITSLLQFLPAPVQQHYAPDLYYLKQKVESGR